MARYFNGRITREVPNSRLILELAEELGSARTSAGQLSNFDEVPSDWRCPGCGRCKREIARINKRGEIYCAIHCHHDHVHDGLSEQTVAARLSLTPPNWCGLDDPPAVRCFDAFLNAMIRFGNTFICADCNTADGAIKRMMSAPPYFTLSPGEIRLCIKPRYRQTHEIIEPVAKEVYSAVLLLVENLRKALIEGIETKPDIIRARMQHERRRFDDASQNNDAAE